MTLNEDQVVALDREPDHDPSLQPSEGSDRVRLGTLLADLGDSATTVATADADATYGQPEADLINELKTNLNLIIAELQKLARSGA